MLAPELQSVCMSVACTVTAAALSRMMPILMQGGAADELCTSVQLRYVVLLAMCLCMSYISDCGRLTHACRAGNGTQPRRALVSVSDKTGLVELAKVSDAGLGVTIQKLQVRSFRFQTQSSPAGPFRAWVRHHLHRRERGCD